MYILFSPGRLHSTWRNLTRSPLVGFARRAVVLTMDCYPFFFLDALGPWVVILLPDWAETWMYCSVSLSCGVGAGGAGEPLILGPEFIRSIVTFEVLVTPSCLAVWCFTAGLRPLMALLVHFLLLGCLV